LIYDETRGVQVWLWPNVGKPANAKPEHAPQGSKWLHVPPDESVTVERLRLSDTEGDANTGGSNGENEARLADLRKGITDWRLLLQIDSDDSLGTMWGEL
jgi:hypothetical protein